MAVPVVIYSRFLNGSANRIGTVASVSGFRAVYSQTSWVSFGHGITTRRFLWRTEALRRLGVREGQCVLLSGTSIGLGLVVDSISRLPDSACDHLDPGGLNF